MWRAINRLLGRGRLAANTPISANKYCHYFTNKVDAVRRATADSSPPDFTPITSSSSLSALRNTTVEDVSVLIRRLPDKSSAADLIPTLVLKDVADLGVPYIVHLFNTSIAAGRFPSCFKRSFITQIIKKVGLDKIVQNNIQLISAFEAIRTPRSSAANRLYA